MATQKKPQKEEPKKRPVMNWGPYPTDRNTSVEVAVWQNEIEVEGGTVTTYNATVKRSFRDSEGNWNVNLNYRPHDIPVLLHALAQAYSWILEQKNPAKSED
jgi:hypothetical protein